jgi:DNA-binding LacI/PurR family transcriptional regulator
MAKRTPKSADVRKRADSPPVVRIERPQALVVQVEQALRQAIVDGVFVDDRLPTEVELAEQFGVSRETVRRATEVLQREGLLTKYRRRGTLLSAAVPTPSLPVPAVAAPVAFVQADYRAVDGDQVADGSASLMLHGAIDAAGRSGVEVVVRGTPPEKLRTTLAELASRGRVRGAVVVSFADDKALRKLGGLRLPLVLLDHDLPVPKLSSLRDDSARGAALAVEHLAQLGHRRIAYVHWRMEELNVWRLRGYRDGMRAQELPVRRAYELAAAITPAGAEEAVAAWAALAPRPTALVCFNNTLAAHVIDSLERRGVRVPEDLSVVGCGGADMIGLTTCQTDWYELGKQAMGMLLTAAEPGATPGVEHRLLSPTLRPGRTAAPVASSRAGE